MYYFRWHIHSSIRTCGRFGEHEETLYSCVHLCGFSIIWRCLFKHWRQCDSSLIGCWRFLCFKTSPNHNIQRCTNRCGNCFPDDVNHGQVWPSALGMSWADMDTSCNPQLEQLADQRGTTIWKRKRENQTSAKQNNSKYDVYSHRSWMNFIPNNKTSEI